MKVIVDQSPVRGFLICAGVGSMTAASCRMMSASKSWLVLFLVAIFTGVLASPPVSANANESHEVMQSFVNKEQTVGKDVLIADKKKHQILFVMGILLLIGIIGAAAFGIAMAVFGKQVFVAHMVFAGFSVFLAIAHAVTAIVWFFPF
ncbi:MAG: hypothetical protein M3A44_03280 [Gammaproteobacteria bacterium]